MNTNKKLETLDEKLKEIANLGHASKLMSWDREVYMPESGSKHRAESISELSGLIHQKTLALDENNLLSDLNAARKDGGLSEDEAVIVRETWREYEREAKLSEEFVRNLSQLTSEAQDVWRKARANNDFLQFGPTLEEIVDMQRKKAEYLEFETTPYDPLLDGFEPGMSTEKTEKLFSDLRDFLVPLIDKVSDQSLDITHSITGKEIRKEDQKAFNKEILEKFGYDFQAGRLDASTHPFTLGSQDVRITTRYDKSDLLSSLSFTLHEMGHGLYEQGLPDKNYGTPLAREPSLGIHESQSRLWENHIGRSQPFTKWLTRQMQENLQSVSDELTTDNLYRELNTVEPSLIRTEADEVTYNLHIIIRFELEKALIEEGLAVENLPAAWNKKYEEYLGIEVPNNKQGVLQDIHWSQGSFGYFPTYTFGNLYAAKLDATIREEIDTVDEQLSNGTFDEILSWLQDNIHKEGMRYKTEDLIENVTGEPLKTDAFKQYIEDKYRGLYDI
ncbi:MAG: carboxypeptidase [Parcubacteria group bacterium SW_6_46_9]|nr:MAG: carboxypeptidase [Parcubacteria group bacterium SW_6_46_9]